jgi:hypothetical protein
VAERDTSVDILVEVLPNGGQPAGQVGSAGGAGEAQPIGGLVPPASVQPPDLAQTTVAEQGQPLPTQPPNEEAAGGELETFNEVPDQPDAGREEGNDVEQGPGEELGANDAGEGEEEPEQVEGGLQGEEQETPVEAEAVRMMGQVELADQGDSDLY